MLDEMYKAVKDFNTIAGSTNTDYKSFKNQVALIYEEGVKEAEEALRDGSVVKMLDSVVDALYVVMGNLQRLELMGCDIQGAIKQVCTDNISKFPSDEEIAAKTVLHYNKQNINASWEYNEDYRRYVIKDENKKVRKPVGFTSTDLSKYVPEELQKKGIDETTYQKGYKKEELNSVI